MSAPSGLIRASEDAFMFNVAEEKKYYLSASGLRSDGVTVHSRNGATKGTQIPEAHAEARLCRKLDRGATVYVARVTRLGQWAMARPCPACRTRLKSKGVRTVMYTIGPGEWGVMEF